MPDSKQAAAIPNLETPSDLIKQRVLSSAHLRVPVEYRFWQPEQLLNDAGILLERCLTAKQLADDLWTQQALENLVALRERHEEENQGREIAENADANERLQAEAERTALKTKTVGQHFNTTYALANSLNDVLKSIVAHGQLMTTGKNGADAAPGGVAQGQAALAAYQLGQQIDALETKISQLNLTEARRLLMRNNETALRDLRGVYRQAGSPLHFQGRIDVLVTLISGYMLDIEDRCAKARDGLYSVYGEQAPAAPTVANNTIEQFLSWVRERQVFLAKFGSLDQGFVVTIPVDVPRTIPGSVAFTVDPTLFSNHSHCRLRGLSLFVESTVESALFRSAVRVPLDGLYAIGPAETRASACSLTPLQIDQRDMPPCWLGRVTSRDAIRSPEVGGTVSLFNASPIGAPAGCGDWEISLEPIVSIDQEIRSIMLELSIVGRPLKQQGAQNA